MTVRDERAELRRLLAGGDRRSIGRVDEVVSRTCGSPSGISALVGLTQDADPLVGMRAADALEKATRFEPALLAPHKRRLLDEIAKDPRQEIRWHLLQMLPRLRLTPEERTDAFAIARDSLGHRSRIVAADALSAMFDLSVGDAALGKRAEDHAEQLMSAQSAAVRSRARRLLSRG